MKYLNKNISKYLIVVVIVLFFIFLGVNVYKSCKDNAVKNDEVISNNYYNFEFLFNNGYIKIADNIASLNEKDSDFYMYLDDKNILHVKYKLDDKEFNKEIKGLPSTSLKVYYNKLSLNCLEVASLSGNDLYYNNFCLDDKNIDDFEMISTGVKDIYVSSVDKDGIYVIDNNVITSNFIINTTLNEIKYISYKDGVGGLYNDIDKVKPYFDYICVDEGIDLCRSTMVYLNFNKELVFKYDLEDVIKDENGNSLIVKDMCATFEIKSNKIVNFDEINFNKLSKYNYLFSIYVLDQESNLYVLNMDSKAFKNKSLGDAFKYSDEKANKIDYHKDEEGMLNKVVITFMDGEVKEIESSDNFSIFSSTLADRSVSGVISAR